jgi:hypothetical protein
MKSQICKCCKKELPLDSKYFGKRSDYKTGFFSKCKTCESNRSNINAVKNQQLLKDNLWTCSTCNSILKLNTDNFYKRIDSITGFQHRCKNCLKKDPNRYDRLLKKDDLDYYLKDRFYGAKNRAINKEIEFNLSLDYLKELWNKQNGKCALTGINMDHTILEGKIKTNGSIDKINPSLGYSKDNIQFVCNIINIMKSDMSIEQLINFCKLIISNNERSNS